tara:strand:+ start:17270 stop:17947 length:678 start_codon:yes stop_codon:yes gene_type:complete
MGLLDRQHGIDSAEEQAVYFAARERRKSLAGIPKLHRTHRFVGAAMAVATIDTDVVFTAAVRLAPITFKTAVRMTADGSVATEHRGLVFEFGGTGNGCALWVGDQTIGFVAGGASASGNEAVALFDNGSELVAGMELELVVSIRPGNGDGRVRLWVNGIEKARATATNLTFAGPWAGTNDGSFASAAAGAQVHADVPAASAIAPDGFEVIEPLSVYAGQLPRQFH